jgi:HprK-related kinase A
VKLSELSHAELRERLGGRGLRLDVGAFVVCLRSAMPEFLEAVQFGYADFRVCDDDEISDFRIRFERTWGLRAWLRPRARLSFDGWQPFFPHPAHFAAPALEWGFNWCVYMYAHHVLAIHAAVLERWGIALLIPAPPGSGKSTLCAALACGGWRLLSDEFALIRRTDGRVLPMPRPISLKGKSIEIIGKLSPAARIGRECPGSEKGTIAFMRPPSESVMRRGESARPGLVLFLTYKEAGPLSLKPVSKAQAFMRLADNGYNYETLGEIGFDCLADAVDACDAYEFSYGRLNEAIERIDQLAQEKCARARA